MTANITLGLVLLQTMAALSNEWTGPILWSSYVSDTLPILFQHLISYHVPITYIVFTSHLTRNKFSSSIPAIAD